MFLRTLLTTGLALAAVLSASGTVRGESIVWRTDLKQAAREASRTGKPMLLEFTASWCGYCKKMHNTTFRDESIARRVNGCFVPVMVDYDTNEELVKAVGVDGLPMAVVISPELTVVRKISGFHRPAEFTKRLHGLCPSNATTKSKPSFSFAKRTTVKPAPAFGGHCLVSMVEDRKLRPGVTAFHASYRGKSLVFTSKEHRRKFKADPERYWPMLDGNCPVTRATSRELKEGSPSVPVIYRRKLWFFIDRDARSTFADNPDRYTTRSRQP